MTTYEVIDDLQARNMSVLLLDREYKVVILKLTIDGEKCRYTLNSIKKRFIIKRTKPFEGKTAVFT